METWEYKHNLESIIHRFYAWCIRPYCSPIQQQRLKLLRTIWGYRPLLEIPTLRLSARLRLLWQCLRVDWCVQHGHWPGELARVMRVIGERYAGPSEMVVEAGCWFGGSSTKLSLICRLLGYQLWIFDSFAGVEAQPDNTFAGQYAAEEHIVRQHVATYELINVCTFVPGWFRDTLARVPITYPTRVVYIDCDLRTGTREVLQGVLPALVPDGAVCSQDYHIREVSALLDDPMTWEGLQHAMLTRVETYRHLAIFRHSSALSGR
jgi:hypothetical protein